LRSSLHPELFAAAYRVAALLADFCGLSLPFKAELLLSTPKVVQAVSAALLDCYTWKLAEKVYGRGSRTALTTVCHRPAITCLSLGYLICDTLAFNIGMQPVAVVLFNTDAVQLP
jgi:hypothetical protein